MRAKGSLFCALGYSFGLPDGKLASLSGESGKGTGCGPRRENLNKNTEKQNHEKINLIISHLHGVTYIMREGLPMPLHYKEPERRRVFGTERNGYPHPG